MNFDDTGRNLGFKLNLPIEWLRFHYFIGKRHFYKCCRAYARPKQDGIKNTRFLRRNQRHIRKHSFERPLLFVHIWR